MQRKCWRREFFLATAAIAVVPIIPINGPPFKDIELELPGWLSYEAQERFENGLTILAGRAKVVNVRGDVIEARSAITACKSDETDALSGFTAMLADQGVKIGLDLIEKGWSIISARTFDLAWERHGWCPSSFSSGAFVKRSHRRTPRGIPYRDIAYSHNSQANHAEHF